MPTYIIFCIFCLILIILNFKYYKKTKRPFASFFIGGITGFISLICCSYLLKYLGLNILINYTTICISFLLGIPGVALMTVLLFI